MTPHPVTVIRADGSEVTYPPSGEVLRAIAAPQDPVECTDGLTVVAPPRYTGVSHPPPAPGARVIASAIACEAAMASVTEEEEFEGSGWAGVWLVSPDTGPESAVRDEQGRIRAVRRLVLWTPEQVS